MGNDMPKDEKGWKETLTEEQYRVLREGATERPFSGKYLKHDAAGTYLCAACGASLFPSDAKFHAPPPNEGWPSFGDVVEQGAVTLHEDNALGMKRTEVRCAQCGSHLGHLFDDGPGEHGGKHFCINSVALDFKKEADSGDGTVSDTDQGE